MAYITIETQPTNEPVSLTNMKKWLRVEISDDDTLINTLIVAAREACEVFTGRSFCTKGYIQNLDSFPYFVDTIMSQMAYPPAYYSLPRYSTTLWNYSQMIKLWRPPLVAVQRITYLSSADKQYHDLLPVVGTGLWYPKKVYSVNDKVTDGNDNQQTCTVAGTSDSAPPDIIGGTGTLLWKTTVGALTVEATGVTWQCNGAATKGEFGEFIVDEKTEPARIFPGPPGKTWPPVLYVPNAVQIHFTSGYSADASKVPSSAITAIMMLVANWYENREAATPGSFNEIPNHIQRLLWSLRVMDLQPTRG